MTEHIHTYQCPYTNRQFLQFTHSCGIRVRLMPLDVSVSCVSLTVGCGSVYEGTQEEKVPRGSAHFIEHMLFHAPDGEDYGEKFLRLGVPDLNAYTTEELTNYYYRAEKPTEGLSLLLKMVLEPSFDRKFISQEKKIILSEIGSDEYDTLCSQKLVSALYKKHYIRHDPGGSPASVKGIRYKHLRALHTKTYVPANMVLSIVGNCDPQEVINVLDAFFAEKEYSAAPKYPRGEVETSLPVPKTELSGKGYPKMLYMGMRDEGATNLTSEQRMRRGVAMLIASQMLEELLDNQLSASHLATAVSAEYLYGLDCGYLLIRMNTSRHETAEGCVRRVFRRVISHPELLQKSFESFVHGAYANAVRLYDDPNECALFLAEEPLWGCELWDKISMIESITFPEFYDIFKSAFDHQTWSSIYVTP